VADGDTAWTAGCAAVVDGEVVGLGDAYTQARTAFGIALDWLGRAGFTRDDVVQTRMYVVDVAANGDAVGRAHREAVGDAAPAATMVGVAALLDPRMLVEVELLARTQEGGGA
jgi:enamine deaminase RidA (YjgF/YER057c/UK114 family)